MSRPLSPAATAALNDRLRSIADGVGQRAMLKVKIIDMHRAHPDWTARMIADDLQIPPSRVTMFASKYGIKLPHAQRKEQAK